MTQAADVDTASRYDVVNSLLGTAEAHFEALAPGANVEVTIDSHTRLGYGRIGRQWGLYLLAILHPEMPKTEILKCGIRRRIQACHFLVELWNEAKRVSVQRKDVEQAIVLLEEFCGMASIELNSEQDK